MFKGGFMENITYKGFKGVFIPNNEFEEIKKVIAKQNELTNELIKGLKQSNNFDELMALKYKSF